MQKPRRLAEIMLYGVFLSHAYIAVVAATASQVFVPQGKPCKPCKPSDCRRTVVVENT